MMSIMIGHPVGLRMYNHMDVSIIPGKGYLNLVHIGSPRNLKNIKNIPPVVMFPSAC